MEEDGCAVCGQLCLVTDLSPLKSIKKQLDVLCVGGITREEHCDSNQCIKEVIGPVIDHKLNKICLDCRKSIRAGNIPRNAMANSMWIGEVPEVLKKLTFMEKVLIQRIRHNGCFIRVASGVRKMVAHAVAFEVPVMKVYHKLPPPLADINEVMVILYTGPCRPTGKDWKRTPVLVHKDKLLAALNWLIINNPLYADIEIDLDALNEYAEDKPPVNVEYREQQTNRMAETVSQDDNGEDNGTSDGKCPFVIHGLAGESLENMTVKEQIATALRHLDDGGAALAVGHSSTPSTIWNNPELYCSIFPWLFPYGLGGIGMSTKLSEEAHKRWLLMYHDK